jgi:predicted ArsR family transcriptional regulator
MRTARQRVFEYIRSHRLVTSGDISKGLGMTRANAHHHLEILLNQELVQIVGKKPSKNKGRPALLYGLSRHSQGENMDLLADALLTEINKSTITQGRESIFRKIASKLIEKGKEDIVEPVQKDEGIHVTKRLRDAIELFNRWHYHARWEAHADSPHIILGNCPYLSILPSHPELCEIDRYLIEALVSSPAEQLAKRTPDDRGVPFCQFRLKRR